MTRERFAPLVIMSLACATLIFGGCGGDTTNNYSSGGSTTSASQNPLNAKTLVKFKTPLIEIPIAPVTTADTYTVTARQNADWDFGLRVVDGVTGQTIRPKDPVTGQTITTPTWYYDVNDAPLGIYGATIESTSNNPVTVTYVNDLRDEQINPNATGLVKGIKGTGPLLTKHLLTVDATVDGMNQGEPEVRTVPHLHGAHVDWRYDGHPEAWFTNIPASQQTTVKYGLAADPSRGFPGRPSDNRVVYTYANDQDATTLWFHDHSYGITRLQAYADLAAFYIIRDDFENTLTPALPKGPLGPNPVVPTLKSYKYDLPVVIQDKAFTADGHLIFPTFTNLGLYTFSALRDKNGNTTDTIRPEMFGTVNVVNGSAWPVKTVEQTAYRFRFLNAADSRVYNLWLQDADTGEVIDQEMADTAAQAAGQPGLAWPIIQIGAEQGLFPKAVPVMTGSRSLGLTLANAERADIVIDFSHPVFKNNGVGRRLILRNDAPAPFGGLFGPANEDMSTLDPNTTGKVMMFAVDAGTASASYDTQIKSWDASLRPFNQQGGDLNSVVPDRVRYIDLQERKDEAYAFFDPIANSTVYRTELLINGLQFSDPITEVVSKNSVEEWVIINTTPDMHPIHLHLVKFQIIEKGHIKAGPGGTPLTDAELAILGLPPQPAPPDPPASPPNYIRADGVGALPEPVSSYTAYMPNTDPREDPSGTPTGTLTPDTPGNSLYARSGNEIGYKDMVKVPPAMVAYDPNGGGEVVNPGYVRIRAKFDLPAGAQAPATYMYHCHIISHEDMEMMRPFTVK
ncbi:multicopper oxidase family protein [Geobacter sp. AOG2]|uniref:multicopper oxidase family protein n=1 Tax=Geobacter sp. AOG2 TaxID=1566347 RepID=UPI001CC5B2C1|nr:multicopper oxidase domain-containing protein [Geobacter sp. AOG2]GFE59609.1 multicopper oxidase [Geobacter sp. AOG2]